MHRDPGQSANRDRRAGIQMMSGRRYLRALLRVTAVVAVWADSAAAKDEALEPEAASPETIAPSVPAASPGKFELRFGLATSDYVTRGITQTESHLFKATSSQAMA